MQNDERACLFVSQKAGRFIAPDDVTEERVAEIKASWVKRGWTTDAYLKLSHAGMVAEGAEESPLVAMDEVPPVDDVADEEQPTPAKTIEDVVEEATVKLEATIEEMKSPETHGVEEATKELEATVEEMKSPETEKPAELTRREKSLRARRRATAKKK